MKLALALLGVALLIAPARADNVLRVTTESVEYCEILSLRLGALPVAAGPLPRSLAEEGRRLCQAGHVRTGIAKLRRALRAAHEAPTTE